MSELWENNERSDIFFRRIDSFVTSSRQVELAGDWIIVLYSDLDRRDDRKRNFLRIKIPCFIGRLEVVDKLQNEHPERVE